MAKQNPTKTDRAISTAKQLNALKPQEKEYEVRDAGSPGLRLRISPKGRMTWFYRYASPETGKTVKLTLGQYIKTRPGEPQRGIGLSEARTMWGELKAELLRRNDPKRELARRKAAATARQAQADQEAERDNLSVAMLVNEYVDAASVRKKSWKEDQRILNKYLTPKYGKLSVYTLTRSHVRDVLEPIKEEGKNVQHNRTLAAIRGMFNWAIDKEWPRDLQRRPDAIPLEVNPASKIKPAEEQDRDRALNDAELRKLLKHLPKHTDQETADFLLFVLATGCRIGEAASMEHKHLFGDEWRQPTSKNGKSHTVFLSDYAQAILERRPAAKGFVWPNEQASTGHIRRDTVSKELGEIMPQLKVEKFTPHDMRRTLATWLGDNEVSERIHDRILNHQKRTLQRRYNVAKYNKPAREWWNKWGQHLQAMSADNVVKLDKGKRA